MSRGRYRVVDGITRKVKRRYLVIDGVTRKIKKSYRVVDGITRLVFSSGILVTHPTAALTANSSNGYVASASSENSSSYQAWRAFNMSYNNRYAWVSKARTTDSAPYIQLKLPSAMIISSISIANRTWDSYVNGIIAATILGSTNGSSWTTICTISGRSGSSSGLLTEHECTDTDTAYQYVRIKPTNWTNYSAGSGNSYVAIGEIYIHCLED